MLVYDVNNLRKRFNVHYLPILSFKMKISAKVLEVKVLRVYKSTEISRPESDSEMNNETSNTGRFLFSTCILLFSNPYCLLIMRLQIHI